MRTLHVAALPFPTAQGTQALVHAMLSALALSGHDTHLYCYPQSAFARDVPYTVHRAAGRPLARSLRSGPSLRKIVQDVALVQGLGQLAQRLRPERVFAHHVEAALCASAAGLEPLTYIAHTSLAAELGSYFPRLSALPWSQIGAGIDRLASESAVRHLAISPRLCADLTERTARPFQLLTPPWFSQEPISTEERAAARAGLGLEHDAQILLYAGNLDAYQGLDVLLQGLQLAMAEHPRTVFLLATASEPHAFLRGLPALLLARTRVASLDTDVARRLAYAASDVALVPRRAPGGLPVKLLEALSVGLPVVCVRRATAGFEFAQACQVIEDDEPSAWALAIRRFFDLSTEHRRVFADRAHFHVKTAHDPCGFARSLLDPPV